MYFCRTGGNRPDSLNELVIRNIILSILALTK
ncbi:copper resistance protein [Escherichia coli]|nr:copper resistance protein [Escherichia coli]EBV1731889.1 copper resistance protein [Salmonella enterica subsp. enterica serovar Typhimurium]EFW7473944.1 copper resistance protein [Shigella sonnei]EFX8384435.1 copper resistance protein [Shigella dysenteriae]EAB0767884.1 copper resistance protein [Escherichia coli]